MLTSQPSPGCPGDDRVSRRRRPAVRLRLPGGAADDLRTVAAKGARAAYRAADGPVIVDDAGLFIDGFEGFPGPYSSYVEDTLGVERVWRMTEPEDDRGAAFKAVIAYCDGEGFEATPDPGGIDREDRRGQDLSADDRGTATTDEQVHDGSAAQSSETVPVKRSRGA